MSRTAASEPGKLDPPSEEDSREGPIFDQRGQRVDTQYNVAGDMNISEASESSPGPPNTRFWRWAVPIGIIIAIVAGLAQITGISLRDVWAYMTFNQNEPPVTVAIQGQPTTVLPQPMIGDFNIAVAQFGEVKDQGLDSSKLANEISNQLFNFIDSQFESTDFGLDIEVAHNNIDIIVEDREAEVLADEIGADLVIYGSIFVEGEEARLSPRFYIANREGARINTQELIGWHRLAVPIYFKVSSLQSQDDANIELSTRAAILIKFTEGLVYFSSGDFNAALQVFQQVIYQGEQVVSFEGQEVLYLLAAEASRLQKNFDQAHEYLDTALAINSEYARAYVSRGNVFYDQAVETSFDSSLLEKSHDQYQQALVAKDQPAGAFIRAKSNVALGNIAVIRAQQTGDFRLYIEVEQRYNEVVNQYERTGDVNIKQLAAIAYFGLGAAYERQQEFDKAMEAYQNCIELTDNSDLKSRAEGQLAIITTETN